MVKRKCRQFFIIVQTFGDYSLAKLFHILDEKIMKSLISTF